MKFLLLALLLSFSLQVTSQVKFGVKGGINLSNLIFKPHYAAIGKHGALIPRFNLGIQSEIPLGDDNNWFLMTGLSYSGKGTKYGFSWGSDRKDSITLHLNYVELPVNVVYKISSGLNKRVGAGTGFYISYGFKGERLYKNSPSLTVKNLHGPGKPYKRLDAGIDIFTSYEVNTRWGLRAEYARSLFKINHNEGKELNNVFGVSFFWWFYNTRPIAGTPKF